MQSSSFASLVLFKVPRLGLFVSHLTFTEAKFDAGRHSRPLAYIRGFIELKRRGHAKRCASRNFALPLRDFFISTRCICVTSLLRFYLRAALGFAAIILTASISAGADAAKRSFDVPSGAASSTLKLF